MKKILSGLLLPVLLLTSLVTACGEAETSLPDESDPVVTEPVEVETVESEKTRITDVQINETELGSLVQGNSEFAFDLYHELSDTETNLFFSPHSISLALAMTFAGAKGDTEQQMADVLHFTLPQDELHRAFNGLDLILAGRGKDSSGKDGEPFRLHIANSIWGQEGFTFLPEYLDTLAENYGTGLKTLDYENDREAAADAINEWVSDETEELIKDIISADALASDTRLVLANAIYFNASWNHVFDAARTADRQFTLLDGETVSVPTMAEMFYNYNYVHGDGYQAIELPYDGDEISMVVILPDAGTFTEFNASFTIDKYDEILSGMEPSTVQLFLPKLEFESDLNLSQPLSDMGMTDAFGMMADFSGMTSQESLMIDRIKHKAFVLVDEEGTEAAAATVVTIRPTSIPLYEDMTVDHPFIFLIRDIGTGEILFLGNVMNPE